MQRRSMFRLSASWALLGVGLGLAACGGSSDTAAAAPTPTPVPPPPAPPRTVRTFAHVANYDSPFISIYEVESAGTLKTVGTAPAGLGALSVAVHPSGEFAYAVNFEDRTISAYSVDAATGMLRFKANVMTGDEPGEIRVHPSGKFAYLNELATNSISVYGINETGALVAGSPLTLSSVPQDVGLDPAGKFLYVAMSGGLLSAYSVDIGTGALSHRRTVDTGSFPARILVAPSGRFLYVTSGGVIATHTIDLETGDLGPHVFTTADTVGAIAIEPSERLLYAVTMDAGQTVVSTYAIEPDGALDNLGRPVPIPGLLSLAVGPSSRFVYATKASGTIATYSRPEDSGDLAEVGLELATGEIPRVSIASLTH